MGRRIPTSLFTIGTTAALLLNFGHGFQVDRILRSSAVFPTTTKRSDIPSPLRFEFPQSSTSQLFASNLDDPSEIEATTTPDLTSLWLFGGIPLLSIILPFLLQFKLIVPLIIFKRVYIYTLAASVLVIASIRGSEDSPSLGTRLIDLTRDALPYDSSLLDSDGTPQKKDDTRFQQMSVLDEVEDSAQAIGLPIIVASSLVASLFFVSLQNSEPPQAVESQIIAIKEILPTIITASNAAVISLFARSELLRLLPNRVEDGDSSNNNESIATIGALILSGLAFIGPTAYVWPIQNILCACLAISVARAIQIPKFAPIVLALSALVVYDVASVGIQLVNLGAASMAVADHAQTMATTTTTTTASTSASSAANSAMGAVALAKTEGSWQPGLFQVRLKGVATDLLGLGDSVFPSLLSTFALRFDKELGDTNSAYFLASIVGFVLGCAACEFVPGISDTGLPALLFLVPTMLTSVLGTAAIRGELTSFLEFDPASDFHSTE